VTNLELRQEIAKKESELLKLSGWWGGERRHHLEKDIAALRKQTAPPPNWPVPHQPNAFDVDFYARLTRYPDGTWTLAPRETPLGPVAYYPWCHAHSSWAYPKEVEPQPEFERTIRLRLSDVTLDDLIWTHDPDKSVLARTLRESLGFTFVWDTSTTSIEVWKGDVLYYSPLSEKYQKFCEQVEEYAAAYLHPSTNLDYTKLPPVNTLNEKLSFHKSTIHRKPNCFCGCSPFIRGLA
jgi:hypothetical protein